MSRLSSVLLLALLAVGQAVRSAHNQVRRFGCRHGEGLKQCAVELEKGSADGPGHELERLSPGVGCFERLVQMQVRHYCPLFCQGASSAFVLAKRPNDNHKCLKHFNYNAHDGEWFFWRADACLNQTLDFDIGCQFDVFEGAVKLSDFVQKARRRT